MPKMYIRLPQEREREIKSQSKSLPYYTNEATPEPYKILRDCKNTFS